VETEIPPQRARLLRRRSVRETLSASITKKEGKPFQCEENRMTFTQDGQMGVEELVGGGVRAHHQPRVDAVCDLLRREGGSLAKSTELFSLVSKV